MSRYFRLSALREPFSFVTSTFFMPKPRVIVFGANPDAIPLVQMAARAGFRVVVADWSESFCNAERFPGVETMVAFPETISRKLTLNERDYVVIMSHQFEKDTAFFRGLWQSAYNISELWAPRNVRRKCWKASSGLTGCISLSV